MLTINDVRRIIDDHLADLRGLLLRTVTRASVKLVESAVEQQLLQVRGLAGAVVDDVEHLQPFGLRANPLAEAQALLLTVGGASDHRVAVIVTDRRYGPQDLEAGEVALHNAHGEQVELRSDKTVITSADLRLADSDADTKLATADTISELMAMLATGVADPTTGAVTFVYQPTLPQLVATFGNNVKVKTNA